MSVSLPARRPLSFAEERLWFIEQVGGSPGLYNTALKFRLDGPLDVAALGRALAALAARHEAFRTGYVEIDDQPVALVMPTGGLDLALEDLSDAAEPEALATERALAFAAAPFDLASPPLARLMLARLAPERHMLLFVAHHIIFDGASIDIFTADLASLYAGDAAAPVTGAIAEAIDAERRALIEPRRSAMLDWWLKHLDGELPTLTAPSDRPRPARSAHVGATLVRPAPGAIFDTLSKLCRAQRATVFMGLLAAWSGWLARYAGQREVVVGAPFSLRSGAEARGLIGYFVNTLPLRLDLAGKPSLKALITRARDASLGAYSNAELPFGDIPAALGSPRGLSASPLFQTMLVVQPPAERRGLAPDLSLAFDGELALERSRFDLTLILDHPIDGPRLSLEYDRELFDPATAERMLDHFIAFLDAAVNGPDTPIDQLPMLSAGEREALLAIGRGPDRLVDARPAHQLVTARAVQAPGAAAVSWSGGSMSYGELEARANRAARRLRALGVRRETPVGVLMQRGPALVCAMLAVMKAGGTYVPLDPSLPKARLEFMVGDARPAVLLGDDGTAGDLAGLAAISNAEAWAWSVMDASAVDLEATPPSVETRPEDLAYVIYTSGSTGQPKGVEVAHGAFRNLIDAKIDGFGVLADSRVLQFVSFGFDVSVSDVLMTLAAGAQLVLRPEDAVGGERLAQVMREQAVSVIVLPASVLATLPSEDFPALRSVIVGGEACSAELVERWALPGRRFVNAYGPTEAAICTTMALCRPGEGTPPLGRPIANSEIHVLDEHLEPTPVGVLGEIHIGGAGLARGYLGRPDLTAERFVPSPFGPPGARLYRTGDLGRRMADGSLMFAARADDQVKIRGVRIELGEIEAVLRTCAAVQDVLVLVDGQGSEKRILAYAVNRPGETLTPASLRDHARRRLPEAMVPTAIMVLAVFPRTPNGKIDRKALVRPEAERPPPVAPRSVTEEVLAEIWTEVLGLAVGVEDDFFALGGQSILATQVAARVRRRFEIELGVRALFEAPTIAALALKVEDAILAQIDADLA